jgi:6-phosphogluconolactonase (cycloisomerase 2 family)
VSSLSVDRSGQTLYAGELNYDSTGNNAYSYFAIGSSGAVSFLNSSGIDSNYHAPLVFSQDNQFAYGEGCYHLGWELFGFARNSDGTLTSFDPGAALPPNNDPDTMWCPTDSDVSVANYLALAYRDLSQQNGFYYLATYAINSDGTLGLVQGSEVTTPFTGESSVAFDPTGTYLAVAGQAGIQVYQLASNGVLTAVGNVQQPTVAFVEVRWDNDNHLYAISDSGLYIFSSNQGALSLLGSPYSVAGAGSLAVLPQS